MSASSSRGVIAAAGDLHLLRPCPSRTISRWLLCLLVFFLGGTVVVGDKTAADYFVKSLPGQPEGPLLKMHAGHIEVDPEHNANLWFWLYHARHQANRERIVIWLNGGPGCSSMDGALMEIGPYRLKDDHTLRYNDGSWDEFTNVLFIDNPVGTGYSYVNTDSYVHELTDMANHLVIFMTKFFTIFPEYEDDDIYIAGESYAGQHIPHFAKAILDRNNNPPNGKTWNVSGLLIGNGWISPPEQYYAYLAMAYKAGIIKEGSDEAKELEDQQARCKDSLEQPGGKDKIDLPVCEAILQSILRMAEKDGNCPNMYDLRLQDKYPSCGLNWPPDLTSVTPYLRRDDVVKALNVNPDKKSGWVECAGSVSGTFNPKKSKPAIDLLPNLIEKGVRTLLFSGDQDLICNHIGTEELIHNMEWNGGKGFELSPGTWAPRRHWTFEGEAAGMYQEARNLTYLLFYNSSHMVPFDYPRRTRDMLDRFLGVDIASIGGKPVDSQIDGAKGVETSVGGHPNSTAAKEAESKKVEDAKWAAYYKSGEVALVVVIILASAWGWYVWRDRRRQAGYEGLLGGSSGHLRRKPMVGDVEAAEFDEAELDELHVTSPHDEGSEGRYSLGSESGDEKEGLSNGHVKRYSDAEGDISKGKPG